MESSIQPVRASDLTPSDRLAYRNANMHYFFMPIESIDYYHVNDTVLVKTTNPSDISKKTSQVFHFNQLVMIQERVHG